MMGLRLEGIRPKVLEPVDLSIDPGELVLLSGASGSGKSLLLRAIADLDPHDGEVWLDGKARSTLPAPDWRRLVGLLPAESHWWGDSVRDHFDLHGKPAVDVDAGQSVRSEARCSAPGGANTPPPFSGSDPTADLTDLLQRLGFGPDVLDWMVSRLSTGERQRLSLARLLANRPRALLLDEATANLDPPNRTLVETLVEDYRTRQGAPVLWVSHDPEQRQRLRGRSLAIRAGCLEPET